MKFVIVIKKIINYILPMWLITRLTQSQNVIDIRYWLKFNLLIRPALRNNFSWNSNTSHNKYDTITGQRILLPLIETSHYQYLQLLILAKSLQIRGAKIKILVCDQILDACEIKSVKNEKIPDPCWRCRFNQKNILPLFGLEILFLSDVISAANKGKLNENKNSFGELNSSLMLQGTIDLTQCVKDSVIRYYYGAVPQNEAMVNTVREAHASTASKCLMVAEFQDQEWAPDIVMAGMYSYSSWEPFFRYYQQNGARFKSISISAFNFNAITIDSFSLFESTERFKKYLQSRKSPILSAREDKLLRDFMTERFNGNAQIFKSLKFFNDQTDNYISQKININTSKRNIFLFSNIYWDVGLSDCSGLYQDVITWVLETIELIKDVKGVHLYIKTHPGEVFDTASSLKGVSQFIKDKYPTLPENVTIISPELKIKTYELFRFIDVGVIFNGTLGLEMMYAGIPIISTGKTTYQDLGFSMEPTSIAAYREALIGTTSLPKIDQREIELYTYFYFIRTMVPWTLTKQAYADNFDGFLINGLDDLKPGKDQFLDHLCNCILDPENTIIEAWPELIE